MSWSYHQMHTKHVLPIAIVTVNNNTLSAKYTISAITYAGMIKHCEMLISTENTVLIYRLSSGK